MLDSISIRNARSLCHAISPHRLAAPNLWRGLIPVVVPLRDTVCCPASTSSAQGIVGTKTRQTHVSQDARKALFGSGVEQVIYHHRTYLLFTSSCI